MKELQALVDAWLIPGPNRQHHDAFKSHLRADWPMLAEAIEDLIAALDSTVLYVHEECENEECGIHDDEHIVWEQVWPKEDSE